MNFIQLKNIILFVLFFGAISAQASIPYELNQKLQAYPVNGANYSIHVQAINSRIPRVSWNSHTKRTLSYKNFDYLCRSTLFGL